MRGDWRPLNHLELGLAIDSKHAIERTGFDWQFVNGVYAADRLLSIGPFRASAQVLVGEKDGDTWLALVFRGTDLPTTFGGDIVAGWGPQMRDMYRLFDPLLDAVGAYVESLGIDRVLVTGHSLGAAMAQYFMAETPGDRYLSATFGSPGAYRSGADDPRMIHFSHGQDIVARAGRNLPFFSLTGEEVRIPVNDPLDPSDDGLSVREHAMSGYVQSLVRLAQVEGRLPAFLGSGPFVPGHWSNWAAGTASADAMASDNVTADQVDHLYGRGGDDLIHGQDGDDFLFGGAENDRLLGEEGADLLVGGPGRDTLVGGFGDDVLSGGPGADIYVFGADFGHDTIRDFADQDVLRLPGGLSGVTARQIGTTAILTHAQGQITLLNYVLPEGFLPETL